MLPSCPHLAFCFSNPIGHSATMANSLYGDWSAQKGVASTAVDFGESSTDYQRLTRPEDKTAFALVAWMQNFIKVIAERLGEASSGFARLDDPLKSVFAKGTLNTPAFMAAIKSRDERLYLKAAREADLGALLALEQSYPGIQKDNIKLAMANAALAYINDKGKSKEVLERLLDSIVLAGDHNDFKKQIKVCSSAFIEAVPSKAVELMGIFLDKLQPDFAQPNRTLLADILYTLNPYPSPGSNSVEIYGAILQLLKDRGYTVGDEDQRALEHAINISAHIPADQKALYRDVIKEVYDIELATSS